MPAEKLTKSKLIQILFMLTILLSAFFWRTITYYNEPENIDETMIEINTNDNDKVENADQDAKKP